MNPDKIFRIEFLFKLRDAVINLHVFSVAVRAKVNLSSARKCVMPASSINCVSLAEPRCDANRESAVDLF